MNAACSRLSVSSNNLLLRQERAHKDADFHHSCHPCRAIIIRSDASPAQDLKEQLCDIHNGNGKNETTSCSRARSFLTGALADKIGCMVSPSKKEPFFCGRVDFP